RDFPFASLRFPGSHQKIPVSISQGISHLTSGESAVFYRQLVDHPLNLRNSRFFSLINGNLTAETGSIPTASTTTHSRFFPTSGDAPKMPANGGLFQCVLRVSRSPEGADGRFRAAVSAAKNPVPGAEKLWWRELRLEAIAAGCALGLKSVNVKKVGSGLGQTKPW